MLMSDSEADGRESKTGKHLPPLPNHPKRGISVKAGDNLTVTNMSISIEDANVIERKHDRPLFLRVPPYNSEYACGAMYQLRRRMKGGTYNVGRNRVDIADDGWSIEVALGQTTTDPVRDTNILAERVLDTLAAEAFRVSELNDPLRQYGFWFRKDGKVFLRSVTTVRMAVSTQSAMEVRDPSGTLRPQISHTPTWHASHSYFRRSQITDDLHDAYRNLFLAFEALMSEVYPWEASMGERKWLESALKHVMDGYQLNMSDFVEEKGGNPYRRFMKEQYRARRCALFHSKLGEVPILPGDLATRGDLVSATRRLGKLYFRLAQLITGAGFAGGTVTKYVFERMVESFSDSPMYVTGESEFTLANCILSNGELELNANGQSGLHWVIGSWKSDTIPQRIQRTGILAQNEDDLVDGVYDLVDIDTTDAEILEVVVQHELANAENLRDWLR